MAKKKSSKLVLIFSFVAIIIGTFLAGQWYRSSQITEPVTNIQYGSVYKDTTEGFEIVYPDDTWGVLRYDDVTVNLSRGQGWDQLVGIDAQTSFDPERYASNTAYPIANFQEFEFTYPSYLYESHNITSAEMGSNAFLQTAFIVLPRKVVRLYRDGGMSQLADLDISELAQGVKEIPVTTGTIIGYGFGEGKHAIYSSDKKTTAANVFVIWHSSYGYRIMLHPGTYYYESPSGLKKVQVELGQTLVINAEE